MVVWLPKFSKTLDVTAVVADEDVCWCKHGAEPRLPKHSTWKKYISFNVFVTNKSMIISTCNKLKMGKKIISLKLFNSFYLSSHHVQVGTIHNIRIGQSHVSKILQKERLPWFHQATPCGGCTIFFSFPTTWNIK